MEIPEFKFKTGDIVIPKLSKGIDSLSLLVILQTLYISHREDEVKLTMGYECRDRQGQVHRIFEFELIEHKGAK